MEKAAVNASGIVIPVGSRTMTSGVSRLILGSVDRLLQISRGGMRPRGEKLPSFIY